MLTRTHRFHGYNSLSTTYRQGKVVRGALFSLKYVRNDRRQTYRVAVVVSKKVSKSAVVRNRIRRRIFEAVRTGPVITGSYDLVFLIYNVEVAALPAEVLQKTVTGQLEKAGVL